MANLANIVQQLKEERDKLDRAIHALTSLNGNRVQPNGGRHMSAAARARISAAQKARWAKAKSREKSVQTPRRKGQISAAGLARIRAAAKARWARVRAQQKKAA